MLNAHINQSDITGEVSGAFLLSVIRSFNNTIILPAASLDIQPSNIEPNRWYPYSYLINILNTIKDISPSAYVLFQAGVNFASIWVEQSLGGYMVDSGVDWLYKSDESGFNSVVCGGSRNEVGWCRLLSMDEITGIAVYENVMPFLPDYLKGFFYGGATLVDDMEYVESEITLSEPYAPNPLLIRTIVTIRFRLKSKDNAESLDTRINNLDLGSTLCLTPEEVQSVIWQNKALKYKATLRESYINELETMMLEAREILAKHEEMAVDLNAIFLERTKELQKMAIIDSLTNLYNRRHFDQILFSEFNRAKREKRSFVIAMLDIDYFKKYNDTYGHQAGDVVLQKIAQVLVKHNNRAGDFSFRTGGEEFAIITQLNNNENYIDYFTHICKSVEDLAIDHSENIKYKCVTISIGVIEVKNYEHLDTDKLYRLTDEQLYKAKSNGRDQVASDII
ncbi:GGDEF domain-containing protein [Shewanella sp. UCD-KL21]|uniref:GGDEF domain-containing protein n=1 Tax=Shewanella sp. UCD-KL21 TaxID=1917164 RepID=UPI0009FABCF8|nr:GGDEF domain-containing protein [Shewanella sp. UCD-KL21]